MTDIDASVIAELAEVVFPAAQGGRKKPSAVPLQVEVVRPLTVEDVPALAGKGEVQAINPPTLKSLRYSHHQLARLLAEGSEQADAALITGYDPEYISRLVTTDKAFQGLLAHYKGEVQLKFVDVLERMRSLGLSTLDEIQRRLEEEGTELTMRELMELAELTLVKPTARLPAGASNGAGQQGQHGPGPGGVTVNVKFVQAGAQGTPLDGPQGPIIEAKVIAGP